MSHSQSVDLALSYADRGWPVLPLNGKKPAIRKGVYGASTEHDFIVKRFANGSNIGIQTGKDSQIVVIDIDPRNGGDETLATLLAQHGELPETLESTTGGGGYHLFFQHPGIRLRGKLGQGIDVKSDGGFVVAPPSIHPETHEPYQWRNNADIATLPQWMVDLLTEAPTQRERGAFIPKGERNTRLVELATDLKKSGKPKQQIEITLLEENQLYCQPPLPDNEVHDIAERAAKLNAGGSYKTRWQNSVMRDSALSMYQRGVLISLSLYMDAEGRNCWPAMTTLEIEFHISRKALAEAIMVGIERGWLHRYQRSRPRNEPGKQKWSYGYIAKMREE